MKITTLIPAYKAKYLFELLTSLVHQTVKPYRIIFSDDSPDQVFMSVLNAEPIKSLIFRLNIEVIEGPRIGGYANFAHLINYFNCDTELVHILCDDDIIYPDFYERHLNAHNNGDFSSSISRRWTANETGQPFQLGLSVPDFIKNHPSRNISITSDILFSTTVGQAKNWLGEVSNTVYRSEFAENIIKRNICGISYSGLEDLGSFLEGSLIKPICFINEHLGFFRKNPEQNSSLHFGPPIKLAFLAYIALAIAGRNSGKIPIDLVNSTISIVGSNIAWHYRNEADMALFVALMPPLMAGAPSAEADFLTAWKNYDFLN